MTRDAELILEYVRDGSQPAFAELVQCHINAVYASAWRQTCDAALAEDVTQAVFILLAKKAATLRPEVVLAGWLMTATWYACKNAMRVKRRRRIHESKVAAMNSEIAPAVPVDSEISRTLDAALAGLGEADRGAVTMRYLQGRSVRDVAAALGVSEEAAQKRVTRAVGKLRDYFRGHGLMVEPDTLAGGLSRQVSQVAPAALTGAVLATVTSGMTGATASAAAVALSHATAKSMSVAASLKPVAIAAAILAVAGVWAAVYATTSGSHVARASVSPPAVVTTTNPSPSPLVFIDANAGERARGADRVDFPNTLFTPIAATDTGWFTFEEDATVRRQPDGAPTISISSPGPSLMPGMRGWTVRAMAWRGKRIEISAYLRTQDVGETTGMNVSVWGPQGQVLATDMNSRQVLATDMNGGPLRIAGTHDWTRMASVLDVPADAERIGFGIGLWGPGRVWIDSFAMQSVPDTVPTTSDTQWHLSTQYTSKYRLVSDSSQPRNGHATARLESPGDGGAATGSEWGKLTRHDRAIGGLAGKRIKIRAMMKSENVTGSAGLFAIAVQYDEQPRYRQTESKHYLPVKGTSGWMPYATTLAVPPEFDVLEYGVRFEGAGTVWIDDITVEALP